MHADDGWITRTYDNIVTESGEDGIPLKETREEFARRYENAVRSGELDRPETDLNDEGLSLFDRIVKPERRRRSRKLIDEIEAIVSALQGETILGRDDPLLGIPCPLGDTNGRDKVLGLWTAEDWRNATIIRYRKAAEMTGAAAIFDEQAAHIERALVSRAVQKTYDLFAESPAGTAA